MQTAQLHSHRPSRFGLGGRLDMSRQRPNLVRELRNVFRLPPRLIFVLVLLRLRWRGKVPRGEWENARVSQRAKQRRCLGATAAYPLGCDELLRLGQPVHRALLIRCRRPLVERRRDFLRGASKSNVARWEVNKLPRESWGASERCDAHLAAPIPRGARQRHGALLTRTLARGVAYALRVHKAAPRPAARGARRDERGSRGQRNAWH